MKIAEALKLRKRLIEKRKTIFDSVKEARDNYIYKDFLVDENYNHNKIEKLEDELFELELRIAKTNSSIKLEDLNFDDFIDKEFVSYEFLKKTYDRCEYLFDLVIESDIVKEKIEIIKGAERLRGSFYSISSSYFFKSEYDINELFGTKVLKRELLYMEDNYEKLSLDLSDLLNRINWEIDLMK